MGKVTRRPENFYGKSDVQTNRTLQNKQNRRKKQRQFPIESSFPATEDDHSDCEGWLMCLVDYTWLIEHGNGNPLWRLMAKSSRNCVDFPALSMFDDTGGYGHVVFP